MKSIFAITIFAASFSLFAADKKLDCKSLDKKKYPDEYEACIKAEIAVAAKEAGVDCVDCLFEGDKSENENPWVVALQIVNPALSLIGAQEFHREYDYAKSQKLWAEAYAKSVKENEAIVKRILEDNAKKGKNPLMASELTKQMRIYQGYEILKKAMPKSKLPTFEEYQKNPEIFADLIDRSSMAGYSGFAKENDTKCEVVTEKYVICDGARYVRDSQTDDKVSRDVKRIEEFLNEKDSDGNQGKGQQATGK